MFNKSLLVVLTIFVTSMPAVFAAGDPMQSLFLFQQKMADKGNASAMMKMGVMYERGEGVPQSYDNALKMYKKANDAGHADAKAAIQRLTNTKNKTANTNKRDIQKKNEERQRAINSEKLQKEREAAALKKAQNAAKQKALREKLNKEKSAKAAREKADTQAKAIKAKAEAKAKAAKDAKIKAKIAKDNKVAEAKAKAAREAIAKAKAARVAAEKKRQQTNKPEEGFKSDPCKGKAARLLSICR